MEQKIYRLGLRIGLQIPAVEEKSRKASNLSSFRYEKPGKWEVPDQTSAMNRSFPFWIVVAVSLVATREKSVAAEMQVLHGHVPESVPRLKLQPLGRLPASQHLNLAIGLPLRNTEALTNLLQQLYDPTSLNYHHYLTLEQFTERFGPTDQDYQKLIAFVRSNGFMVKGTHSNRVLLDVDGSVADIEKNFHVNMRIYRHPTEIRTFYAPDTEPSLNLDLPLLHIDGLDNYAPPRPMSLKTTVFDGTASNQPYGGSGPYGTFLSSDLRKAYAPGVSIKGSGQAIGLLEFDGYYTNDVVNYAETNGLGNVAVTNILIDGFSGDPSTYSSSVGEVSLDIDMALAMAPEAQVIVYETSNGFPNSVDIFSRMATDNLAKQISSSWSVALDGTTAEICQEFALQGQSFFQASGDGGAFPTENLAANAETLFVGGTLLTTDPTGAWSSETTWNAIWGVSNRVASGGGITTYDIIPPWQKGINMSANHGSTTWRNFPDVAMVAQNVWFAFGNGQSGGGSGTSAAAPLWAGFTALINQQAEANGDTSVGFLNPAIYAIGKGPHYASAFHDITTGNNTNSVSPTNYFAVPGYDLCTGWGTPNGSNLINLLVPINRLSIAPAGNRVVLSWAPWATRFGLQSTTNLTAPHWVAVSNSYPGTFYAITSSLPSIFFRLYLNTNTTANNASTAMVLIPGGSFTMGDTLDGEADAMPTVIASVSPFYMDVNLISNGKWLSVYTWATNHGFGFVSSVAVPQTYNHPVQPVNWFDAVKWCNARSQQDGLTPVYYSDAGLTQVYTNGETTPYANWSASGYRLPTEAEWEEAARGGLDGQRFPLGDTISESQANYLSSPSLYNYDLGPGTGPNPLFEVARWNGATDPYGAPFTSPVGYFAPNDYGLYDMAGNVWQWCWDWYGTPYVGGNNPQGPVTGSGRVLRGGDCYSQAYSLRCASRWNLDPTTDSFGESVGFRCVRRF